MNHILPDFESAGVLFRLVLVTPDSAVYMPIECDRSPLELCRELKGGR